MNSTEKLDLNKCRTCYKATKGLKPLTDLTSCSGSQQISYAELLADVSNINVMEDLHNELPQSICDSCSRKLQAAQAFIQQTHEVNERLMAMLIAQKEANNELNDDVEEAPVQIKMEYDEVVVGEESEVQWQITMKDEPEEILQDDLSGRKSRSEVDAMELMTQNKEINSKQQKDLCDFDDEDNDNDDDYQDYQSSDSDWEEEENDYNTKMAKEIRKTNENDDIAAVPCHECNEAFSNNEALVLHYCENHIREDQKSSCPVCFRKFPLACSMYTHMYKSHDTETIRLKQLPEKRIFQCTECPKNYTQRRYLFAHVRKKHSQSKEYKETADNKSNNNLCSICGHLFPTKSLVMVHMRQHTVERPFKCNLCDHAAIRLLALTLHQRIHTGAKPFACKICGQTFRTSGVMKRHKLSHMDIKTHKCTKCKRSFRNSRDLNLHFRMHTGERPYICNVCEKTFTRTGSLKSHRIRFGHMEN